MHESAFGTKRTYRDCLLLVRFRGEADMDDRAALTASVVDDPKRTKTGLKSRSAAGSPTSWSGRARPPASSWGPSAHLSIENERLNRYGYARQDFASLDRRVRLMQVAHGAGENSRHAGTAAPRPATEVNRHRKLLCKFK